LLVAGRTFGQSLEKFQTGGQMCERLIEGRPLKRLYARKI
jgi:hypothetical protein